MKQYSIRNWGAVFENNRSRTVETLHWVPIPNRHDGENYKLIMSSEHGSEIFAAWVLVIQVASKCQPRGTLLRGNGLPHTAATLSLKTSAPEIWFKRCLEFLEKHTDWLNVVDVASGCRPPVSQPSAACQSPDEEGNGREGMEENGIVASAPPSAPVIKTPKAAKPIRKPRERNELMDTLATVGGGKVEDVTESAWSSTAKALSDIRAVCPEVTANEIQRRAFNYERSWPGASLTPMALAKHWATFDTAKVQTNGQQRRPVSETLQNTSMTRVEIL